MSKLRMIWHLLWSEHWAVITRSKWACCYPKIGQYQLTVLMPKIDKMITAALKKGTRKP